MNIKFEIIKLLIEVNNGKYSNVALSKLYKNTEFSDKEKSFFTETFYGTIRNKIFIDFVIKKYSKKIKKEWIYQNLAIAIYQGFFMNSDIKGVVWEASENSKKRYGIQISKFTNAVLRNIFREKEKIVEELEEKKLYNILYSYPDFIYEKIKKRYPENFIEVLKSYKKAGSLSIRVNLLKYSEFQFERYLKNNKIDILKKVDTVYYLSNGKVLSSKIFKEGKVIVQDASSYLAARSLGAIKDEYILDSCSAPGGKALVIAEKMENQGKIEAIDIHEHKIRLIKENSEKLGVNIIEAKTADAVNLEGIYEKESFDRIIADVPCSGIGVIRKKPETLYNKEAKDILRIQKIQRDIMASMATLLKVGGTFIYSTCTILKDENTDNVSWFLENNNNFEVSKIELDENIEYNYDEFGGIEINYKDDYLDGFYIIKLKRVI